MGLVCRVGLCKREGAHRGTAVLCVVPVACACTSASGKAQPGLQTACADMHKAAERLLAAVSFLATCGIAQACLQAGVASSAGCGRGGGGRGGGFTWVLAALSHFRRYQHSSWWCTPCLALCVSGTARVVASGATLGGCSNVRCCTALPRAVSVHVHTPAACSCVPTSAAAVVAGSW